MAGCNNSTIVDMKGNSTIVCHFGGPHFHMTLELDLRCTENDKDQRLQKSRSEYKMKVPRSQTI